MYVFIKKDSKSGCLYRERVVLALVNIVFRFSCLQVKSATAGISWHRANPLGRRRHTRIQNAVEDNMQCATHFYIADAFAQTNPAVYLLLYSRTSERTLRTDRA